MCDERGTGVSTSDPSSSIFVDNAFLTEFQIKDNGSACPKAQRLDLSSITQILWRFYVLRKGILHNRKYDTLDFRPSFERFGLFLRRDKINGNIRNHE
jgi:hypothetical protein